MLAALAAASDVAASDAAASDADAVVTLPLRMAALGRFLTLHAVASGAAPGVASHLWHRADGRYAATRRAAGILRSAAAAAAAAQRGGRQLGTGREGTRVYTADELAHEYPTARMVCLHGHAPGKPLCTRDLQKAAAWPQLARVALKDIPNAEDSLYESGVLVRVRDWMVAAGALDATCLHPDTNCVVVRYALVYGVALKRRLVATRLMQGDVSALHMTPRELLEMSRQVLRVLCVLHANSYLHMDVKPHNVLYERAAATAATGASRYAFALGDFGLAAHVATVLANAARGGSPSGTDGFTSPLLATSDADNRVFGRFQWAALATGALPRAQLPAGGAARVQLYWQRQFDRRRAEMSTRDEQSVFKADLHSLGLTLLSLGSTRRATVSADELFGPGRPLGELLARLLFFRKGDFRTAPEALAHVEGLLQQRQRRD